MKINEIINEKYTTGRKNPPPPSSPPQTGAAGGTIQSQGPTDPTAQTVKGNELDAKKELETGEPVGKGTVTFTNDNGEIEDVIASTTGTRKRMARQSAGANVRNIG